MTSPSLSPRANPMRAPCHNFTITQQICIKAYTPRDPHRPCASLKNLAGRDFLFSFLFFSSSWTTQISHSSKSVPTRLSAGCPMKYGNRHVEWRGIFKRCRSWVQCLSDSYWGSSERDCNDWLYTIRLWTCLLACLLALCLGLDLVYVDWLVGWRWDFPVWCTP